MKSNKQIALLLGIAASFFFAITFVVNRLISLNGGSWIWSASLRFFFDVTWLSSSSFSKKKIQTIAC
jgi:hypothetical protein